eukprot:gnl/Spiro4/17358_TR9248_c0_g1_i1.p1 gnl/Spiro4/17358_TR9248_c0_g1~~gnl/Spiro4/17358_TR9248_c0_g1_i1.p1  ORF type:complete len:404 (-),score=51.82 gnl/Spiro4/17358_TR9248_c0_g1_i1:68-1219(-)
MGNCTTNNNAARFQQRNTTEIRVKPIVSHPDGEAIFYRYRNAGDGYLEEELDNQGRPLADVHHKIDRYGYMTRSVEDSVETWEASAAELRLENSLSNLARDGNCSRLKQPCRTGLPFGARGPVWLALLQRPSGQQRPDVTYQELLCSPDPRVAHQIDVDVARTERDHIMFKRRYGRGQQKLFNVLMAFATYNQQTGYCQGMSGMVALLLMFLEEEDAFWGFVRLFEAPYHFEHMFETGFPRAREVWYIHDRLVEKYLPELSAHLTAISEPLGMKISELGAIEWYMNAFCVILPFPVVLRIWDYFLSEGYKVIFSVAIALLRILSAQLLKMDFSEAVQLMKHPPADIDVDQLLDLSIRKKVKERVILGFQAEYQEQLRRAPRKD